MRFVRAVLYVLKLLCSRFPAMVELPAYKAEFVDFLLETGALAVGPDRTLKSGRISPTFVNMGQFENAGGTSQVPPSRAAASATTS